VPSLCDLAHPRTLSISDARSQPSGSAASALSLFTTLDSGAPLGWGSAEDVQERYVDSFKDSAAGAGPQNGRGGPPRMTEEEFEKQEEERIYSAWREWRREEIEKKRNQQEGKGAGQQTGQTEKPGEQDSRGLQRDGMNIKERWKRQN
jgi:hypothetical protein